MYKPAALLFVAILLATSLVRGQDYNQDAILDYNDVLTWGRNDTVVVTNDSVSVSTPVTVAVTGGSMPAYTDRNAETLTIGAADDAAAGAVELVFEHTGTIAFDRIGVTGGFAAAELRVDGAGAQLVAETDVVLGGVNSSGSGPVGHARLTVENGGQLKISDGDDTNDLNANEGLWLIDGQIAVRGGGGIETRTFTMGNAFTTATDNSVTISGGGSFVVTNDNYVAGISRGDFDVQADSGTVEFRGGVSVGEGGALNVATDSGQGPNIITLGAGKTARIGENATLNITGNGEARFSDGAGGSSITNAGGTVDIGQNATLYADSFASLSGTTNVRGTLNAVGSGGGILTIGESAVTVSGTLTTNAVVMTGGILSISGTAQADTLSASSGTVTLTQTGRSQIAQHRIAGNSVFDVSGTLASGTKLITADGGAILYNQGTRVGSGSDPISLEIGGTSAATLYMAENITTTSGAGGFALTGGNITVTNNKTLTVSSTGGALSMGGNINFINGNAVFNDSISFYAGGLFNQLAATATVTMAGGSVEIKKGANLNASVGDLVITGASGLAINGGSYRAGWQNDRITMARVTQVNGQGDFSITANSTVAMTNQLQARAQEAVAAGETLLILETECLNGAVTSLSWKDTYYTYQYQTDVDAAGNWGLYVIGVGEISDEEKHIDLYNSWNKHPKVNGHADKLINADFANAIVAGRKLQVSLDYDKLTNDGRFNADALGSLTSPDTAGYDSLMLYNGSGLAMANQAVLASNGQTMNRLGLRNTWIRREMAAVEEDFGCGSTLASEFLCQDVSRRVWASAHYTYDRQYWDEGFGGYEYRSRGLLVGYDRLFGGLAAGAAFSYTGGDFEDDAALGSNSTIDTYGFHLYGTYNHPTGAFVTGMAGYAYTDNQIEDLRIIAGTPGQNSADYRGRSWMAAMSVGYDWEIDDCLTVTPSIGLSYQTYRSKAHQQYFLPSDGTMGAATLNAGQVKNHSTMLPLRLAATYDVVGDDESLLTLNADIGYAYELHGKGAAGRVGYAGLEMLGTAPIASRAAGRHVFTVGAGGKYLYKQYEFGLNYEYMWRNEHRTHLLLGSFGVNF